MKPRTISLNDLQTHYSFLDTLGKQPDGSYTRLAWSDEESAALSYFEQQAKKIGLECRYDDLGNLFIYTPGEYTRVVQVGSHLDTVPNGGNFDGVVGILAGFLAISSIYETKQLNSTRLELVIWRGEEGATFGSALKGSLAAFGMLDKKSLDLECEGKTLAQAIQDQGYDPTPIKNEIATLSQDYIDKIIAHIEIHIEQGNKLEKDSDDIAVATSINGARRLRVYLTGSFDHSGATPLGVTYRSDTNLALGYIITELDNLLKSQSEIMHTIGIINSDSSFNKKTPQVYENAITKVSGYAYFTLDIRGSDDEKLEAYEKQALGIIKKVAEEYGVKTGFDRLSITSGIAELDPALRETALSCAKERGYSTQTFPCGAGHDVATVANQKQTNKKHIPCTLLLIPCKGGISHSKEESASFEDIQKGTQLLTDMIWKVIS